VVDIAPQFGQIRDGGGAPNILSINAQGQAAVDTEGRKATYSAAVSAYAPYATAQDILAIAGSATRVVRVTRVEVSGRATAANQLDVQVLVRSAANSGGSQTTLATVPHDANNGTATASVVTYGAAPSAGGLVGVVRSAQMNMSATGSGGAAVPQDWDFTTRNVQALALRGVGQMVAVNLNGAAIPAGTALDLSIEWTEENLTGE
jgi:hypothetical protein